MANLMRKRAWRDSLVAASAALFAPSVLFVLAPNGIILRNLGEVPYDWVLVLGFLKAFVLASAVLVPLFLAAQRWRVFATPTRLVAWMGVSVFLWDASGLLLAKWGGSLLKATCLEGAVFSISLFALFRLKLENLYLLLAAVSPVLLASTVVEHYITTGPAREQLSVNRPDQTFNIAYLIAQEKVKLSNVFAYDQATSGQDVEVTWGMPFKIRTSPGMTDKAVEIPIAVTKPIEVPAYIHIRARVLKGNVKFGILSSDHARWLEGTVISARKVKGPADNYIRVPLYTKLGPLVVANSTLKNGRRSIVEISDISLNLIASEVPSFKGNVYHILFDGYQSEAYQLLSEADPEGHELDLVQRLRSSDRDFGNSNFCG